MFSWNKQKTYSTTTLDPEPQGVVRSDEGEAQDDAPWHLQIVNVLTRMVQALDHLTKRYGNLVEEIGVFQPTATPLFVAGSVVATQATSNNILVHDIVCAVDTSITSYTLTLGDKVWRFNSTGSNGLISLTNLNLRLGPGDVRSLVPVSGTPAFGALYICGENVRLI